MSHFAIRCLALLGSVGLAVAQEATPADPLRDLQLASIADRDAPRDRVYAFGWQGLADVFSTHRTHSNRPVLALTFGRYASLSAFTGAASPFRSPEALAKIFGNVPPRTVDPTQMHLDQSQLHELLLGAADQGAKRIIVLLLDGCDWQTYAAASTVLKGTWDPDGYGAGLPWFEYVPPGTHPGVAYRDQGSVVTTPIRGSIVPPGFDVVRGGRFPWSPQDATYLAGDLRTALNAEGRRVSAVDRATAHMVVDSAASATAIFSGVKTLNGRIGADAKGEPVLTLGRRLQTRGFTVATVTDVPFDHASPAAVYASCDSRAKYQEIGRQMLGLGPWPKP